MRANDLHNFRFHRTGSGSYQVHYFTDARGDYWVAEIFEMEAIDATWGADHAKVKDINYLRWLVQRCGTHYNSNGEVINDKNNK